MSLAHTDGTVYAAWGGQADQGNSGGPVCYATRSSGGGWSVTPLNRETQSDRFELKVGNDGTVYLLRGSRPLYETNSSLNSRQESLYLERYREGAWQTFLANAYPTQSRVPPKPLQVSILDADLDIDAQGNAYLVWIDDGNAW